ncbi:MAG: hypothetical protein FMNOHCHN_01287 [Ignavibacteriaceae bacterium]|nr:hypothetical protein [Ignavibacteriaceae bacterium]
MQVIGRKKTNLHLFYFQHFLVLITLSEFKPNRISLSRYFLCNCKHNENEYFIVGN